MSLTGIARAVLTAAVFFATVSSAPARRLQRVLIISGSCKHFEAVETDLTEFCQDRLSVNVFDDSRTSFTFIIKRIGSPDVINTFTGQGNQQVTNATGNSAEPIDGVIYTFGNDAPNSMKAVGLCKFSNLYKPKSFVDCIIESGAGRFNARFEGDTSAPVTINPR